MIPDTFLAGFLVAFFALEVVRPFATGFIRGIRKHFGKTPPASTLEDEIGRWLNSLSVRTVGRLFARIRIIRSDIERALKFDEVKPPNERFNFLGRVFLEEIAERLKAPTPPRDNPCANCGGDGLLPCPSCGGNGEQPDNPLPPVVPCALAGEIKVAPDSRFCIACNGSGGRAFDDKPCPICNGVGLIPKEFGDTDDPPIARKCSNCEGRGFTPKTLPNGTQAVIGDPCSRCKGKGFVDA